MKKQAVALFVASVIIVACGDSFRGAAGPEGLPGTPGANGTAGTPGVNGYNSLIQQVTGNDTNCPNGGTLLLEGLDTNRNGSLETAEVQFSMDVCNGATGATGATGPQGPAAGQPQFTPVIVIEPCGHNSSAYKEALLGLSGGGIYGSFTKTSDALTVRNILIPDGGYYDTDDSKCNFSVSTDGSGNRAVTWDGSSQSGNHYSSGSANYTASTTAWALH